MRGFGAYAGLGLDVPMTKFGTTPATGHPAANNTGTCSDSFAVQQMLTDLGFSTGGVDGLIGNNTFKALASFATSTGTPYTPGDFPRAPMCQALMDAWTAAKQPAPAPVAPAAPLSRIFINPAIIAAFAANKRGASLPAASAPSGGAAGGAGWWGSLSGTAKIGIVGGGALVLGLIVFAATRKKKAAANRRRRARARRNHAPYSVYERGYMGSPRRERGTYESMRSALDDAHRAEKLGEEAVITDGHGKIMYDTRWG